MSTWVEFWDQAPAIYVSERHLRLHAEALVRDFARVIPNAQAVVLDHGCGEALYADAVAARCGRLILTDAAQGLRARLSERLRANSRVSVLAPEDLSDLPAGSIDLIVANSLLQYLSRADLVGLLASWRRLLRPSGRLILADVVPPHINALSDGLMLLRFAWRGGFTMAALRGLARTALSEYRRTRAELGFTKYSEAEMLSLLRQHGFSARRVRPNFGHNQARMCFEASLRT